MTSLLFSRRFGPIFSCMALAAFNDNYYKNALIVLITYVLSTQTQVAPGLLINIAAACFIVPFFLFSGIAGLMADKYAKHRLVRIYKMGELIFFVLAALALYVQHMWALLIVLFLLGTLASFFGPVKYAILPELVKKDELLSATGLVEGGTFVSILLGTLLGGLLIMQPDGVLVVGSSMIVVGVLGVIAAWCVPITEPAQPQLFPDWRIVTSIIRMLRDAFRTPKIATAILGVSWFWAIGATYLTQIPVFTKDVIGGNEQVVSLYLAVFSIGIALGSVATASIMKRSRKLHVPFIALSGVMLFGLDLCWVSYGLPAPSETLSGIDGYFSDFAHYRITFDLFMLAFCGGVFCVPLYTALQVDSSLSARARTIASNNVMNAVFIATASLLAAGFYALQLHVRDVLLIFALFNLPIIALLHARRAAHS